MAAGCETREARRGDDGITPGMRGEMADVQDGETRPGIVMARPATELTRLGGQVFGIDLSWAMLGAAAHAFGDGAPAHVGRAQGGVGAGVVGTRRVSHVGPG